MDWGPFPELVEQLARTAPRNTFRRSRWRHVVAECGSPWDLYAQGPAMTVGRSSFWPASLPPSRRKRSPSANGAWVPWLSLTNWVTALFTCRPERIDKAELATTLAKCHAWLGNQVMRYLVHLFSPFWYDMPVGLSAVSPKAIVWTLYAYALDTHGPRAVLRRAFLPATMSCLESTSLPGDALSLHMHIETLVQSLPSRLLHLPPTSALDSRHPGGFRTSSFLKTYAALLSPEAPWKARAWRKALNLFIDNSPLTQLVYADLIEQRMQSDAFATLGNFGTKDHVNDGHKSDKWWHDLWYSHLARSLLGAMLSEPPVFQVWHEAEERLRKLEDEARHWAQIPTWAPRKVDNHPGLLAARRRCNRLRHTRASQYMVRLGNIASMLNGVPSSGISYLHVRVLDMLVRHIVTHSMPAMLNERRIALQQMDLPRARNVLFDDDGACFKAFEEVLFGQTLTESLSLLGEGATETIRDSLIKLLDCPKDLAPEILERLADVPESSAQRLLARFTGEPDGRIELPFSDYRTAPPATLVADCWLPVLLKCLPRQSVQVVSQGDV